MSLRPTRRARNPDSPAVFAGRSRRATAPPASTSRSSSANGNDYAATTSLPVNVQPQFPSDVDLVYTTPPKSPVHRGRTVKFSGTVYVPADDQGGTNPQTPIVGANVYVFTGSEYTSTSPHAVTNTKGEFSISVKPSATTTYTTEVVSSEPWPYSLYVPPGRCQYQLSDSSWAHAPQGEPYRP
jgi:hypothetical protein